MRLQTERLQLREFQEGDWTAVLAYHSSEAYQRFYPEAGRTPADAQAFVNRFVQWQRESPRTKFQWAVVLPGSGQLVGNCGLRKPDAAATEAEIGCELAPEHWAQGHSTELGRLLLRFGFEELGLHRIHATCLAENTGAVRLVETLGLRLEGRLRETALIRGRWCDSLVYGILEQEWRAR